MNNFEAGERRLQAARAFAPEMDRAFDRASWNVTVHRDSPEYNEILEETADSRR